MRTAVTPEEGGLDLLGMGFFEHGLEIGFEGLHAIGLNIA
jgi:hypothetical protein